MLYLKLGGEEQLNLEVGASIYPLVWAKNLTEMQSESNKAVFLISKNQIDCRHHINNAAFTWKLHYDFMCITIHSFVPKNCITL